MQYGMTCSWLDMSHTYTLPYAPVYIMSHAIWDDLFVVEHVTHMTCSWLNMSHTHTHTHTHTHVTCSWLNISIIGTEYLTPTRSAGGAAVTLSIKEPY